MYVCMVQYHYEFCASTHPRNLRALPKETRYIGALRWCVAVNVQYVCKQQIAPMYVCIYRITPITKSGSDFQKCKSVQPSLGRYLAKIVD